MNQNKFKITYAQYIYVYIYMYTEFDAVLNPNQTRSTV